MIFGTNKEPKNTVPNDFHITANLTFLLYFSEKFGTLGKVVQRGTKDKCQPVLRWLFCME